MRQSRNANSLTEPYTRTPWRFRLHRRSVDEGKERIATGAIEDETMHGLTEHS
jgi:hypothetical protein